VSAIIPLLEFVRMFFIVKVNWIDRQKDHGVVAGSYRINRLVLRTTWCCLHLLNRAFALKRFPRGAQIFSTMSNILKYVQHISTFSRGGWFFCAPPWLRACFHPYQGWGQWRSQPKTFEGAENLEGANFLF